MSKINKKIGFIGSGNMGEAFVGALIQTGIFSSSMIYASDISEKRLDILNKTYGISVMKDNFKLFSECEIVIFALKPQHIYQVLSQISEHEDYQITNRKIVISIAAGIPLRKIEDLLYNTLDNEFRERLPIIRVMPNTPALVLAGMSGMSPNKYAKAEDVETIKIILRAIGKVIEFKEEDMDAVTALSGSGPAYVFYMAEAMIEGGIKVGLEPDKAAVLTLTTIQGALKLMEESNESPEILRQKVTSPGGTTEAAFKILDKNRVKENIIEAIEAAKRRSKELSR
ncbi:MAG: pyrroline-5-carboxylate reductase [Proteobacteria bacterium]|nr:pyrroline-5-carboxylate reductase [Desulfobacteraceae bacterium]MBU3980086.1 pyrroline-5-carboxylate reductase [Pseudomonadota bacterium]MBU4012858.1 pyrroline-5-carboxylate reductase [Pseudomonadota bacterium]MBU4068660.1 pyrroline-5-carboxylate reductase [Pseudomonadota bacterium]MBU4101733.1 pyrroline-5-carboxylate reductase [Pseudomonadota bacterium]